MKQHDTPPTLDESYAVAVGHGDLSDGSQGILAAAAWTEVHLGSALRRLRAEWENSRPRKKVPRPVEVLRAAGRTREEARRMHNREKVQFALAFYSEKVALRRRIPEYQQVLDQLTVQAVRLGMESADTRAAAVLARWLDDPGGVPDAADLALWTHLCDCLNRARAALRQGVGGHTKHEFEREELDAISKQLGLD